MKNFLFLMLPLLTAITLTQCAPQKGTTVEGTIQNAGNLQAFMDKVVIGQANSVLGKVDINGSGDFEFSFPEGLEAGVYNLRIGARRFNLVTNGQEKKITLQGDLNNLETFQGLIVSGSPDTEDYVKILQGLVAQQVSSLNIETFIDTCANPMLGAFVAFRSLSGNPGFRALTPACTPATIRCTMSRHAKQAHQRPTSPPREFHGIYTVAPQSVFHASLGRARVC